MNRTQIYLDERQTARLDERAAAEGTSRSTVIRRAVDIYLEQDDEAGRRWRERWAKAVAASAGLAPDLEEGASYVDDVRDADLERLSRFER